MKPWRLYALEFAVALPLGVLIYLYPQWVLLAAVLVAVVLLLKRRIR